MTVDELYTAHSAALFRYVMRRVRNYHDAEDICAQVWLEATGHGAFDNLSPHAWLYRVAASRIVDRYRHAQRRPALSLEDWHIAHDPSDAVDAAVLIAALLPTLTPRQQVIIGLRFFERLGLDETARRLGVPIGTVKSLQLRALRSMARQIAA